jgi:L-alanine-DL-glutamate epimerase-like enolase superfamily enzyme
VDRVSLARFDQIALHRLRVPLTKPYRLAFGPVEHYDTIVAQIVDADGASGLGEATVLTGYTDETIDESWRVARDFAEALAAIERNAAGERIAGLGERFPFTATAFGTALDMLGGHAALDVREPTRVPLLGLLHAEDEPAIAAEFDQLAAAGFRTIKVKIGFDARRDAERVRTVQRVVAGRARIRLDANQGYSAEDGVAFVRALDPADIELFEQPCAAGDWDAHLAVARAASVPMMLDESIYGLRDIERAAELRAASYIKVKLMKLVTLDRLAAAIQRIRALGMKPVLGNGVACDLGCWMEACIAARTIDNAGEMNGFLKARGGLLATPLAFRDGAIVLEPGFRARLDRERVARYVVDAARVTRAARATRASQGVRE